MSSKKRQDQYTAGLVSKPFWFYEYKAYVNELLNGSSADEIRSSAFEKHLFSAAKEYRVKEILNCVSRRVTQFDQDWQELFGQQSVMVQRMMVLLSIMADDKLFFTFRRNDDCFPDQRSDHQTALGPDRGLLPWA